MASPFAAFRKYQAILLAVFGVIIILLFTVGDQLMKMTQEHPVEDPVAVKFHGGKLSESEVRGMIYARSAAASLLEQIRRSAMDSRLPANLRGRMRMPVDPRGLIITNENLGAEATIRSMLLARKATEMGMQVSKEEVQEYLRGQVGFEMVTLPQIREIIEGTKKNPTRRSVDSMVEPIRQELLARQFFDFLARGMMAMPPAEQFANFSKVYQKAKADVIAIPVDEFLEKVPEPSDKELAAYFDRFKDTLPHTDPVGASQLASASPGFKLPHRAKVQYLKANFNDYVDRARPQVTDQEIAKFYEENKERFPQQDLPLIDPDKKEAPKKEGNKKDPVGDKKPEPADADKKGSANKDVKDTQKDADKKPAAEPAKKDPKETPPAETKTPPSATKSPTTSPAAATELALADDKDKEAKDKVDAEKPKEAGTKAEVPSAEAKGAGTQPIVQGTALPPTQAAVQGTGGVRPAAAPPAKIKPLAEVKDEIHKMLAEQKATEAIEKDFNAIETKLQKHLDLRLTIAADPKKKLPPLPNFNELAKEYNLTAHSTGLLSAHQMLEEADIGKSYDPLSGQPYIGLVFANKGEHSLHHVLKTTDESKDQYLSWKIEDEDEKVPPLEGVVKQEVLKHWKRGSGLDDAKGKARGLAVAAAEQLAERIRKGESIADAAKSITGAKLIETNPFSWMTYGELRSKIEAPTGPPKLSEIDGIDDAGHEFMGKVFNLKPGEVGVALNHPQNYVYVVKVRNQETSPRVLQETFVADMTNQVNRLEISRATELEVNDFARRLFDQLDKDYQVKWEIPAAEIGKRTES
ncbi:MAG: hypothetical protein K8T91_19275 [Planctomycetes bacterium]|nr:hypothetical protein [Planctomycetota bacterium]